MKLKIQQQTNEKPNNPIEMMTVIGMDERAAWGCDFVLFVPVGSGGGGRLLGGGGRFLVDRDICSCLSRFAEQDVACRNVNLVVLF